MRTLKIGDLAPDFHLPGVDGKDYSLEDFKDKKVVIVMFSCNSGTFVKISEDTFVKIQRDYGEKGVVLIAINSNDDKKYPEDSFENMKIRAREKSFNFPYLRDDSQNVARAYGAERTPEVFVFDEKRTLRYHGQIGRYRRGISMVEVATGVRQSFLRDALDALLRGEKVPLEDTKPVGSAITWK